MHQCHGEGCDSRQLSRFPALQDGALPAPGLLFPYPHRPATAIALDAFKAVSGGGLWSKGSVDTALSHRRPIARSPASLGHGKKGMGQPWRVQDVTPELVPVTQKANAPQALPLAAVPCAGTARPLRICFLAAGSQRLRAPSGFVHCDTKGRRAQVSDCKHLARCSRLIAGSSHQVSPSNGTVASEDRTVPTLQHTSVFKHRTLQGQIFPSIHYISGNSCTMISCHTCLELRWLWKTSAGPFCPNHTPGALLGSCQLRDRLQCRASSPALMPQPWAPTQISGWQFAIPVA